jgi:hypothetical protein
VFVAFDLILFKSLFGDISVAHDSRIDLKLLSSPFNHGSKRL